MLIPQLIINGLVFGGLVAIAALGLAVVFGVARIINFAHGEFITIGAYATWLLVTKFGINPLLGIPAAFLVGMLIGAVVERYLITRVVQRPELHMLLLTYGLSLALIGIITQLFTGDLRSYSAGPSGTIDLGFIVGWRSLTVLVMCLLLAGLSFVAITATRFGLGVRAIAANADAAAACGINVRAMRTLVFGLACGLAGSAGALVSLAGTISPSVGQEWLLDSFVVVVLGGMGSLVGTIAVALGLGVVRSFMSFALGDVWSNIFVYTLMYAALLLRPAGLLGRGDAT